MRPRLLLLLSTLVALPLGLSAQSFTTGPCQHDSGGDGHRGFFGAGRARFCEVRSTTLPLNGDRVAVLGKNGSIEVVGEDRHDVALEAEVVAQAATPEQAQSVAREVTILTAGTIESRGPSTSPGQNWSVSFRLRVPHRVATDLHTSNGSVSLSSLDGNLRAETTNGGLELNDLAGNVHAGTVNGGVSITLSGNRWSGSGLDAQSTNGGIEVRLPSSYNAHLSASTTHGGISVDVPVTVQGTIGNRLETNLGQGGAPIHLQTTNGGIDLSGR